MIKSWQCLPEIAQRVKEPYLTMPMQMAGGGGGGGGLSNGHSLWEKWDFCSEFEKHFQVVII